MKNQNAKNKISAETIRRTIIIVIAVALLVAAGYATIYYTNKSKKEYKIEEISQFNYYIVKHEEKYGVIDTKGNLLVKNEYESIIIPNPEKPVFICYYNHNQETGEYDTKILNDKGNEIFTEYDEVDCIPLKNLITEVPYEKSVLKYKKNGKYGLIDYSGKVIEKPIYEEIENLLYKEGELLVKQDGKYGVINIKGTVLVKPEYDGISSDGYYDEDVKYRNDGYIISTKTDEGYRYGYIDYTGKQLLKMEYNDIVRINNIDEEDEIYLVAQKNGQSGLLKNEKQILNFQYQGIEFDEQTKLLILEKNKRYGISRLNGTVVLSVDYTKISIEGIYIYADKDNQSNIYDLNGNKQTNIKFKNIIDIENNDSKITVDSNGKYGVIDKNGKIIVSNKFYYLEQLYDNYFIAVGEEGKVGVINNKDEVVIDLVYDIVQKIDNSRLFQTYEINSKRVEIYDSTMVKLISMEDAKIQEYDEYIKIYSDNDSIYLGHDGKEKKNTELFSQNTLFAIKENGKWGFSDKNGNIKVKCQYDRATDFNEFGFAAVSLNNKWGVVNQKGEVIVEPIYKIHTDTGEPEFIGEYYKVVGGYSDVYYSNEVEIEEEENE